MTGSSPYHQARWKAMMLPTRQLRRVERSYRAQMCDGGRPRLSGISLATWRAVRHELGSRNVRLAAVDQPPRSTWRRWWSHRADNEEMTT